MSNIQGTNLAAPVVPYSSLDTFPTHLATYGKGGHRTVNTIIERNAISIARRELLMTVAVIEDGNTYKLISNPTTATTVNVDWIDINNITETVITDISTASIINLSESMYYKSVDLTTCNITLNTTNRYAKILWCIEVNSVLPVLTFTNKMLWRYDNDLEFQVDSFNVFEFETWNNGESWLGKVSKYSETTPEQYIDGQFIESEIESAMTWKTA